MDKLLCDSAEISNKVMDILRAYHISNCHSEPYHQNKNPAEWRYRTIKPWTNTVMNRSGVPANCWLLCLIYVCYVEKPLFMIGLISSCPDQFCSCAFSQSKKLLIYMYLSQLMSTFTNYLKVHHSLDGFFIL